MSWLVKSRPKARPTCSPSVSIWISDDLLQDAYQRFLAVTTAGKTRPSRQCKRDGSTVPGPFEARRRLAGRRINNLSAHGQTAVSPTPPPSYFWGRPAPPVQPYWTYEPPSKLKPPGLFSRLFPHSVPQWISDPPPPPAPGPGELSKSSLEQEAFERELIECDVMKDHLAETHIVDHKIEEQETEECEVLEYKVGEHGSTTRTSLAGRIDVATRDIIATRERRESLSTQDLTEMPTFESPFQINFNFIHGEPFEPFCERFTIWMEANISEINPEKAGKLLENLLWKLEDEHTGCKDAIPLLPTLVQIMQTAVPSFQARATNYDTFVHRILLCVPSGSKERWLSIRAATLQLIREAENSTDHHLLAAISRCCARFCADMVPSTGAHRQYFCSDVTKELLGASSRLSTSMNDPLLDCRAAVLDFITRRNLFVAEKVADEWVKIVLFKVVKLPYTTLIQKLICQAIKLGYWQGSFSKIKEHKEHKDLDMIADALEHILKNSAMSRRPSGANPYTRAYLPNPVMTIVNLLYRLQPEDACPLVLHVSQRLMRTVEGESYRGRHDLMRWLATIRRSRKWTADARWLIRQQVRDILLTKFRPSMPSMIRMMFLEPPASLTICINVMNYAIPEADARRLERLVCSIEDKIKRLSAHGDVIQRALPAAPNHDLYESLNLRPAATPAENEQLRSLLATNKPILVRISPQSFPYIATFSTLVDNGFPDSQLQEMFEELFAILLHLERYDQIDETVRGIMGTFHVTATKRLNSLTEVYIKLIMHSHPDFAVNAYHFHPEFPMSRVPGLIAALIAGKNSRIHPQSIITTILADREHGRATQKERNEQPDYPLTEAHISQVLDASLHFAYAARFSNRASWANVWRIWKYLRIHRAPVDSRIGRAMVISGILRLIYDGKCWKLPRTRFEYVGKVVRELEGDRVADLLHDIVANAQKQEAVSQSKAALQGRIQRWHRGLERELYPDSTPQLAREVVSPFGSWRTRMKERVGRWKKFSGRAKESHASGNWVKDLASPMTKSIAEMRSWEDRHVLFEFEANAVKYGEDEE